MKYYNLRYLTFSQLEIFFCSVESGSFYAAAQKLNYSPSMISKTISGEEKALGLILFLRSKHSNTLTPAGRSLYNDCKSIFSQIEEAVQRSQTIQTGILSSLSLGCCDTMIVSLEVENIVRKFSINHPSIAFHYEDYTLSDFWKTQNKLDIIITAKHDVSSLEETSYAWRILLESYYAVFVHRSNKLFEREKIDI